MLIINDPEKQASCNPLAERIVLRSYWGGFMVSGSGLSIRRNAFTLVELLVVIAIIGILVALLLPAIQAAREAARRAKCQSNLHNLALAVLNFESAKKRLPTGFLATGPGAIESWGWGVYILPYIEEQGIYDQLRPSEKFEQPMDGAL